MSIFDKYELETATDESFLLPEDKYELVISGAEEKETKSGGQMISVRFTIPADASDHANWSFYENYNVVNSNETAQNIGRSQFKKLLEACDAESVDDLSELEGRSIYAVVGTQKGKNGYRDSNKIKNYV